MLCVSITKDDEKRVVVEFQERDLKEVRCELIHAAKLFPRNCQKSNREGLKLVISVLSIISSSLEIIFKIIPLDKRQQQFSS